MPVHSTHVAEVNGAKLISLPQEEIDWAKVPVGHCAGGGRRVNYLVATRETAKLETIMGTSYFP